MYMCMFSLCLRLSVYVYLCLCAYVHMCICGYESMFMCIYVYSICVFNICIHVYVQNVYICICVFVYVCNMCICVYDMCMCAYVCMCICVYVLMYVYVSMFLCICVSVYVYLYLYMHMYKWNTIFKHNTHTQLLLMVTSYDEDRVWGYCNMSMGVKQWSKHIIWVANPKQFASVALDLNLCKETAGNASLWAWSSSFYSFLWEFILQNHPNFQLQLEPFSTRRFQLSCFVWTFCVFLLQPKVVQRTNPR